MSSTIKLLPLTFLIASKPAPVGNIVSLISTPSGIFIGAEISSGPDRDWETKMLKAVI